MPDTVRQQSPGTPAVRPELTLHYENLVSTLREIGILESYAEDDGQTGLQLSRLGRLFEDETLALFFSPAVKRTLGATHPVVTLT